jgi:hypothetical protein
MLSGISGEVKTTVAEAQTGVLRCFRLTRHRAGLHAGVVILRSCAAGATLEAMDYPTVSTVASRPGRTKASVPTLALGFTVAGRAKAPVPTLSSTRPRQHRAGLVLASGPLVPGAARGRSRFLNVGGNLSACRFQHVVFLAVTLDLQRAQEVHQVPRVVGLNGVGE